MLNIINVVNLHIHISFRLYDYQIFSSFAFKYVGILVKYSVDKGGYSVDMLIMTL